MSKAKSKAAARPKKTAKKARRDVKKLIRIGITPPHLSGDSGAFDVDALVSNKASRPGPVALSKLPWLRQNLAYQVGYHLMTHGLGEHAGHLEIEVCNVPGVYVQRTAEILNEIADYILNDGGVIRPGEAMSLTPDDDPFMGILGFRLIKPGKGGVDHEVDVLRLLFLR